MTAGLDTELHEMQILLVLMAITPYLLFLCTHRIFLHLFVFMPRCIRIFILIIRRLAFFIATKVLLFLLPLPFFPNVSIVLAKFFGIPPLALKQPKVNLPAPSFRSFINLFIRKRERPPQMKSVPTEPTTFIGEKIRTWRKRYLTEARGMTTRQEVAPQSKSSEKIGHVESEAPSQDISKIVYASMETLEQVYHSIYDMELISFSDSPSPRS